MYCPEGFMSIEDIHTKFLRDLANAAEQPEAAGQERGLAYHSELNRGMDDLRQIADEKLIEFLGTVDSLYLSNPESEYIKVSSSILCSTFYLDNMYKPIFWAFEENWTVSNKKQIQAKFTRWKEQKSPDIPDGFGKINLDCALQFSRFKGLVLTIKDQKLPFCNGSECLTSDGQEHVNNSPQATAKRIVNFFDENEQATYQDAKVQCGAEQSERKFRSAWEIARSVRPEISKPGPKKKS